MKDLSIFEICARLGVAMMYFRLAGEEVDSPEDPGEKTCRAPEGFLQDDLKHLCNFNLIVRDEDQKTVTLTAKGFNMAEGLKEKFYQTHRVMTAEDITRERREEREKEARHRRKK